MNNGKGMEGMVYDEAVKDVRTPANDVHPVFINRWSSRAFTNEAITKEQIYTLLEAAHYAPSANNFQPWRFVTATTPEEKALFQQFILPRNRVWADQAGAYILIASDTLRADGEPNGNHAFDTGAAWGMLAVQAKLLGLTTRAMGGFERAKAKELLQLAESIVPHIVVAVGVPGDEANLDESFQAVNKPTPRKSLEELVIAVPTN